MNVQFNAIMVDNTLNKSARWLFWLSMVLVLLLGVYLRFGFMTRYSLWMDEGISVVTANPAQPFSELMRLSVAPGFLPPLHFIVLRYAMQLFGASITTIRAVPSLFGVLSIIIIALLGRLIVNWRVGVMAALLLALSPFHIYYSLEVRPYSETIFAALLYALTACYYSERPSVIRVVFVCFALLYGCAINTMFLLVCLPVCAAIGIDMLMKKRGWQSMLVITLIHILCVGLVWLCYRKLGLISQLSTSLVPKDVACQSLLVQCCNVTNALIYGAACVGNIFDHYILLSVVGIAFLLNKPIAFIRVRMLTIAAILMIPFIVLLFRHMGIWVAPNPRYFVWILPLLLMGVAYSISRLSDIIVVIITRLISYFLRLNWRKGHWYHEALAFSLALMISGLGVYAARINVFRTFLSPEYEKSPWNAIRDAIFEESGSNRSVVVVSTVLYDPVPYVYFSLFDHTTNLTYIHRHGGPSAVEPNDVRPYLTCVARGTTKLIYTVNRDKWRPDERVFTCKPQTAGYPAIDMFVSKDVPFPIPNDLKDAYTRQYGPMFIEDAKVRIVDHYSADRLRFANAIISTNTNITYPNMPFLTYLSETGCYAECDVVLDDSRNACVSIVYFSGLELGLDLMLNGTRVTSNACTNITGWCAWTSTNELLGPFAMREGTNTLKFLRLNGRLPNLISIDVVTPFIINP
jgi:hypothetical protein